MPGKARLDAMGAQQPPTQPDEAAHEELALLAELAPLGVLVPESYRRLRDHVDAGCRRCDTALDLAWSAVDVLALATPVQAPPPAVRTRLLHTLREGVPARMRSRAARGVRWLAAASLAALVAGISFAQWQQLQTEREARASAESELLRLEERHLELTRRNVLVENALDVLYGPQLRTVSLSGESAFAGATVRVVVDPSTHRTLLLARELPPPPAGRTYQLWLVAGGTPRSLGVFRPDTHGRALEVEGDRLAPVDDWLFAVSVEPEGGVPAPTGPIVLAGK